MSSSRHELTASLPGSHLSASEKLNSRITPSPLTIKQEDRMVPTIQSKHESCDFSGSVYLITSDGRILDLPIPSASPHDPLNWSLKRRALASFAIGFFSFVGLAVNGLQEEFSFKVMLPRRYYSTSPLIFLLGN